MPAPNPLFPIGNLEGEARRRSSKEKLEGEAAAIFKKAAENISEETWKAISIASAFTPPILEAEYTYTSLGTHAGQE